MLISSPLKEDLIVEDESSFCGGEEGPASKSFLDDDDDCCCFCVKLPLRRLPSRNTIAATRTIKNTMQSAIKTQAQTGSIVRAKVAMAGKMRGRVKKQFKTDEKVRRKSMDGIKTVYLCIMYTRARRFNKKRARVGRGRGDDGPCFHLCASSLPRGPKSAVSILLLLLFSISKKHLLSTFRRRQNQKREKKPLLLCTQYIN